MTAPGADPHPTALGLPAGVTACLFDLDGVLTDTASLHFSAWEEVFDEFLRRRAATGGAAFAPFTGEDYRRFVDGRVRADGTRAFLASRGVRLPDGTPSDPPSQAPGEETVHGLGNRKNALVLDRVRAGGVRVYPDTLRYLEAVRAAGLRVAVVSASANTAEVLRVTGLERHVEARVDGVTAARDHLAGKPAPDTFLAAARALGVPPRACAVVEDALSGVRAGRAGGFGHVIGVNRVGPHHASGLREAGADVVVAELTQLLRGGAPTGSDSAGRPERHRGDDAPVRP